MLKFRFIAFVFTALVFTGCVKDTKTPDPEVPNTAPKLSFSFKAVGNNRPFVPGSWYLNASLDSFTVTRFSYYISNIKLKKDDGTVFSEAESYHLIRHVDNITSFDVSNVPEGNYTSVEFLIGVDSLRNVSGSQTGDLDPANQMFWEWSTGYKFFVMEGNYRSSTTQGQDYSIHIGGFSGKYSCLQKCSLNLANPIMAQNNKSVKVNINTVLDEVFKNPTRLSFDDYYAAIGLPMFQSISVNYRDMFVVDKIEN